jgi:hypothetical protein
MSTFHFDPSTARRQAERLQSIASSLPRNLKLLLAVCAWFLFGLPYTIGQRPSSATTAAVANRASNPPLVNNFGRLPLSFQPNRGQADGSVRFVAAGSGYAISLTDFAAVLELIEPAPSAGHASRGETAVPGRKNAAKDFIQMELVGASTHPHPAGADELPGTVNYFIGNDPAKWRRGIPTYASVRYPRVYPGVDLVYYGNQQQLEYDFVVAPRANARSIRLHFIGAKKLRLSPSGDLSISAKHGKISFRRPEIYQVADGRRQTVTGRFVLLDKNAVGFRIGKYDHTRSLVIDPILAYSTYLGGSGYHIPAGPECCGDYGTSIAVDSEESVYVAGVAGSGNFPVTKGSVQTVNTDCAGCGTPRANGVAFVTRLNAAGTQMIYSTFLGGTGDYYYGDVAKGIAVDAFGDAYVTGYTGSSGTIPYGFPTTTGAYQTTNNAAVNGAYTAFVSKLSPDGTTLLYSTYLGGSGFNSGVATGGDSANGIAVDDLGDAIVAGTTYSKDFPVTPGAPQTANKASSFNGSNLFVTKLDPMGQSLVYSTYLGGSGVSNRDFAGADYGTGVAVDSDGNAYVTGYAHSLDYPVTSGAYQTKNMAKSSLNNTGASNVNSVVTKIDLTGTQLVYSTYLGGTGNPYVGDEALGIAVDGDGNAYVTGLAGSQDFPTTSGAYQTSYLESVDAWSGFITKLNSDGSDLWYSTFLGGATPAGERGGDTTSAIAVDDSGDAYVTGTAYTLKLPVTSGAFQAQNNEIENGGANYYAGNAFMTEISPDGSSLVYSSYLGGSGPDVGFAIAVDNAGNAYVTGATESCAGTGTEAFPTTTGAVQTVSGACKAGNTSATNAFISKFGASSSYQLTGTTTGVAANVTSQKQGGPVTFTATVKPDSGTTPVTGTVGFSVDAGPYTYIPIGAGGKAAYSTTSLLPGEHTILAAFRGDVNYTSSKGSTTEKTIGPPALIATIAGSGQKSTYASAFAKPLVVVVQDSEGNPISGETVAFTGTGLKFSGDSAITAANGEASVTATAVASGNLTATASVTGLAKTTRFTLTADKAVLTVTANNATIPFDKPLPRFTYSAKGFLNGDTRAVLKGAPAEKTTAKQGSPAGTYLITITQGKLSAANYSFRFVNGVLTIAPVGKAVKPIIRP